ncbi:Uma2 family endonuclease [Crocosphaera sp. XPORK-15E]|uniref:Uma2 family endonuclease n=1 Tax=Crocosphaera sp. XPORK-15E TaxID=3110247 RepID=UPI002B1EDEF8|nr:Uma2 family endonuclease [Crocosphaera sp. XPORK-15E]MEA5533522.1 Uma2 family endonuclease [Crocosphaera sp. XPORK-15E]
MMTWQDVCNNKQLQDLPFKIELNKWGQIIMSPAKVKHSFFQGIIADLLNSFLTTGLAFPECAIETSDNTKIADVVWASDQILAIIENETSASIAPEICVEIISASNTLEEMKTKRDLYLEAKAEEVWLCDEAGNLSFYNKQGKLDKSLLVPQFPQQVKRRENH